MDARKIKLVILITWTAFARPVIAEAIAPQSSATVTPDQFREDLQKARSQMAATHPQLDYTVDIGRLDQALGRLTSEVNKPLTKDEAWRRAATLNPLLADGHLSILSADWRAGAREYLAAGGQLFPFEVSVSASGEIRIISALGGETSQWKGREISSINGVSGSTIVAELLALAHGDTDVFRASLLSRRWWWYYWKRYGSPVQFRITIADTPREVLVPASATEPVVLRQATFDETYRLELKARGVAVLTIKSFYWDDKDRYYAFMDEVFERVRRVGASTLIIDIRENGGGDDDMWMRGILKYIAGKPYKTGSSYVKRIIEGHRDEGETIGGVKVGQIATVMQPETSDPRFFRGKTYVLIGPYTYSSAILFANVVKDYGFATLAGMGGAAKRGQTGGIQSFVHPASGLELVCPRFYLLPPSGGQGQTLLEPDIRLHDNAIDPGEEILELLRLIQPASAKDEDRTH